MEATTTRERAGASAAVVDDRPRTAPVKEAGREPVPEKNGAAATPEPPEAPPGRRPNRWLILAILAVDLIPNGMWGLYPYVLAGALTGALRGLRQQQQQQAALAAAQNWSQ